MLPLFMLLFGGHRKVGDMLKGYLIIMGILIIANTLDYIFIGLKYVLIGLVFISSLLVVLYVLSIRYQQKNYLGRISSNIIYFILNTKVTRAKDMLRNNNQHYEVCNEIVFLFKNFRPNDAKFLYRQELGRVSLDLNKYKLNLIEEDEVLKPFKNWFCDVEKYFLQSYTVEDPNLIDTVFENLN